MFIMANNAGFTKMITRATRLNETCQLLKADGSSEVAVLAAMCKLLKEEADLNSALEMQRIQADISQERLEAARVQRASMKSMKLPAAVKTMFEDDDEILGTDPKEVEEQCNVLKSVLESRGFSSDLESEQLELNVDDVETKQLLEEKKKAEAALEEFRDVPPNLRELKSAINKKRQETAVRNQSMYASASKSLSATY